MLGALSSAATALRRRLAAAAGGRGSLTRRVLSSSAWRFGGHGISQVIRLASNLILTRLLAPEDFGLMGIVLTIHAAIVMSTDLGVGQAVLRSRHGEETVFLRTAWTLQVSKHALVTCVIVAAAALLGRLQDAVDLGGSIYADPSLPALLAVNALSFLVRGAESPNLLLAERRMQVRPLIVLELVSQVVGVASTILFAMVEPSVWAIVAGSFISTAARCILSHAMIEGPRMGPRWEQAYADEIWSFGKWLMGASLFGFLGRQGDRLLLGAFMSPVDFGLFVIARIWIDAATTTVNKVTSQVTYAALSEVSRTRPEALARAFGRLRLVQNGLCAAGFAAFVGGGELLAHTLYTDEYAAVGPLIVALAPIVLFQSYVPFGSLVLSSGDSRSFARVTMMRCAALFVTLPLAFLLLGDRWAVFAIAVNQAWGVPGLLTLAERFVPISPPREFALLAAAVGLSAALAWGVP